MASNFITYTKHGVAESTLLKATQVGHHYNLVNESKDIDNGSVAVMKQYDNVNEQMYLKQKFLQRVTKSY